MKVRLNGAFADLELSLRAEPSALAGPPALALRDEAAIRQRLRAAMLIRPAHAQLRALLLGLGDPLPIDDEPALLDRVARLVVGRVLELRVLPHELMASDPVELFEDLSERSMAPAPAPVVEATHWIEYALQRPDGAPMPGVRCEIELPWGVTVIRTSDHLGVIRLDFLPEAGDAVIRLPSLDEAPPPEDGEDDFELVEVYSEQELGDGELGPPPDPSSDEPETEPKTEDDWALVTYTSEHEQPELSPRSGSSEPGPEDSGELELVRVDTDDHDPPVSPGPPPRSTRLDERSDETEDDWDLVSANAVHEQPELTPK